MQIVDNEQLKDALEWTCKYVNEYKVDIDIHIDADGEVSVSVCPTYKDRQDVPETFVADGIRYYKADTPQTDCEKCAEYGSFKCTKCDGEMYYKPQTDCAWKEPNE